MRRYHLITLFFTLLNISLSPASYASSQDLPSDPELTPMDHFDPSPRPPSTPWDSSPHHPCYPGHHHPGNPYPAPGYPQPTPGYPYPAPGCPQPTPGYPYPAPGYPQPTPGYPGAPGYFICYARSWRGYLYEGRASYRNYAQNAALTQCYQSGAGECQLTYCTPW